METGNRITYSLSARVAEFTIPPVVDGLILGKNAPIGHSALSKALDLLIANRFQSVSVEDDVISHIIVRRAVLRRVPEQRLVAFVLERLKPLMGPDEVLHVTLSVEVKFEETSL